MVSVQKLVRRRGLGSGAWVCIPRRLFPSWVTLGKSLYLCETCFPGCRTQRIQLPLQAVLGLTGSLVSTVDKQTPPVCCFSQVFSSLWTLVLRCHSSLLPPHKSPPSTPAGPSGELMSARAPGLRSFSSPNFLIAVRKPAGHLGTLGI